MRAMSGRRVAVLGIAVGAALATWILWHVVAAPSALPNGNAHRGTTNGDAITADQIDRAANAAHGERDAVDRRDGSATSVAGEGPAAPQVQVRVLGIDGAPIAGIPVRYMVPQTIAQHHFTAREWEQLAPDPEAVLQRFGATATSGIDGIAHWPWRGRQGADWQVSARLGTTWGEISIAARAHPTVVHDLRLQNDQSFAVRVIDAEGAPVPGLELHATAIVRRDGGEEAVDSHLAIANTDSAGLGTFRHVQTWTPRIAPREALRPFAVRAFSPGLEAKVDLDATSLPVAPVVMQLPATGAIQVSLCDSFGKPLRAGSFFVLQELPDGVTPYVRWLLEPGAITLHSVALGKRWRAWVPGGMANPSEFDGPKRAGEVIAVELRTDPCPTLTGILLLDGVPRSHTIFRIEGLDEDGPPWLARFPRTDGEGRFRTPLVTSSVSRTVERLLFVTSDGREDDGFAAVWNGSLRLDVLEHDLGTLALRRREPLPVLVAGHVVGDTADFADVDLRLGPARREGEPWPDGKPQLQIDYATGAFTFRGTSPTDELLLAGPMFETMEVKKGQTDVRIELQRGGVVTATFATTSRDVAICVHPVLLDDEDEDSDRGYEPDRTLDSENRLQCRWNKLSPGTYRLVVRSTGSARLLEIRDLEVRAGQLCDDPRLRSIALPELRRLVITVPKPERDPGYMARSKVEVLANDRGVGEAHEDLGERFLLATARPLDVRVRVPGYREAVLRSVFEDRTVALEPGIIADIVLHTANLPPHKSLTLRAELENTKGDTSFTVVAFPHQGGHRVLLPRPGSYTLAVDIGGPLAQNVIVECEPSSIEVPEHGGSFAVRASAEK